jgi:hypothetical protein
LPGQSTKTVEVEDITVESLFGGDTVVEAEPKTTTIIGGEGGSVTFVNAAGETETINAEGEQEIVAV